ncbi:MAG TPA: MlaD family protein [Chthoniobacterales bacterium]
MKKRNLNDWAVVGMVILCSLVVLAALSMALMGKTFGRPERVVRVAFPDITGVKESSAVRYAGAVAGFVYRVRPLTSEQRIASGHPENTVEIELALSRSVPALTQGARAEISADTLLSEKFVQLVPGPADSPVLAAGAILTGQAPTPFDQLAHTADRTLFAISQLLSGDKLDTGTIFSDLRSVLSQVEALLKQAEPVLANAGSLVNQGNTLLADPRINETLTQLRTASASLARLSQSGEGVLQRNQANLDSSLQSLKVSLQNLKLLTTYGAIFTRGVAERPQSVVWGNRRPPEIPAQADILKAARTAVPPD